MYQPKSPFLKELQARGFIHQVTDMEALDQLALEGSIRFYVGYDATASSLHVGNLLTLMAARVGQKHGHQPIILIGGGTTKIGDPSGKDASRQMLTDDNIKANISTIRTIFEKILDQGPAPLVVDNNDWLSELNYLQLLRDYGTAFTVNRMLTFESVKRRLDREQPLTFLEFNYIILQSYDFLELYRTHGCLLQMGGSDQWGNIVSGVDLIRRMESVQAFGLTFPLLQTASGAKMGKSAEGAVWLHPDHLSPFDYFQFWRNTDDQDVKRFLKLYTDLPVDQIESMDLRDAAQLNETKSLLAYEATRLVHGEELTSQVLKTVQTLYGAEDDILETDGVDAAGNPRLKTGLPVVQVSFDDLAFTAIDVLVLSGLCGSKGEARRLIQGRGARINGEVIEEEAFVLTEQHLNHQAVKVSSGKKKHVYVQFVR